MVAMKTINEALDLAHDAYEGTDIEAKRWARVRLEGLLDLQARSPDDVKRICTMHRLLTEQLTK